MAKTVLAFHSNHPQSISLSWSARSLTRSLNEPSRSVRLSIILLSLFFSFFSFFSLVARDSYTAVVVVVDTYTYHSITNARIHPYSCFSVPLQHGRQQPTPCQRSKTPSIGVPSNRHTPLEILLSQPSNQQMSRKTFSHPETLSDAARHKLPDGIKRRPEALTLHVAKPGETTLLVYQEVSFVHRIESLTPIIPHSSRNWSSMA